MLFVAKKWCTTYIVNLVMCSDVLSEAGLGKKQTNKHFCCQIVNLLLLVSILYTFIEMFTAVECTGI